jgi:hypothetical protein
VTDLQAELKRRLQALYEIALDVMSDEEAGALFYSIPKRGRGKRGPGRNPHPTPSKDAVRKRRKREGPPLQIEIERELTKADIERMDQYFIDRMNRIAVEK